MSYITRLNRAFENAPLLPITAHTKYAFFSDCHRGIGDNNDNFLKNSNSYIAALQHYYQYGFNYIEVGDGDELWENRRLSQISEIHDSIFSLLCRYNCEKRLYMLYGNHDIVKKHSGFNTCDAKLCDIKIYEGLILKSTRPTINLYITHGHQADFLNSVLWRLARFLVRYLWTPLEYLGLQDPTSAAKNNKRKNTVETRLTAYARSTNCLLLAGHTHRPTLGNTSSPYCNCGSCVHPSSITCIELCGYRMNLAKWHETTQNPTFLATSINRKGEPLRNTYRQCPPEYPIYVKRELLATENLLDFSE